MAVMGVEGRGIQREREIYLRGFESWILKTEYLQNTNLITKMESITIISDCIKVYGIILMILKR